MRRSKLTVPLRCRPERIAVALDLENLLYAYRAAGDWGGAVRAVERMIDGLRRRGTVVALHAVCDRALAKAVAFGLEPLGVRVHVHRGGQDAADRALIAWLGSGLPASCGTVVIGSGDHIFAPVAARLRASGRRVEMASVRGHDALALRSVVDLVIDVPSRAPELVRA